MPRSCLVLDQLEDRLVPATLTLEAGVLTFQADEVAFGVVDNFVVVTRYSEGPDAGKYAISQVGETFDPMQNPPLPPGTRLASENHLAIIPPEGISNIRILLKGGNDWMDATSLPWIPPPPMPFPYFLIAYGSAGNDELRGGATDDFLIGGDT